MEKREKMEVEFKEKRCEETETDYYNNIRRDKKWKEKKQKIKQRTKKGK